MVCAVTIGLIVLPIALALIGYFYNSKKAKAPIDVENKHIVITGGSSGIGKSLAILLAKLGAHVTIVARNRDKLKIAMFDIRQVRKNNNQKVITFSLDVANYDDFKRELYIMERTSGPIFGLINCAGMAICGKIEDIPLDDIQTMVNTNFLGSLYPTKAIVPLLKERGEGFLVFTASQVALMGMFGYSVYSACKFALRGLAESVDMEVRPYNVSVTLALPPDTATPGYENENKTKPLETKLISESAGLFDPDDVAAAMLNDILVSII